MSNAGKQIIEVRIPTENVNDETVRILGWRVSEGHRVEIEQPLVEVETSKATFDIPAPAAGVVTGLVKASSDVPIGAVLCRITPDGAAPAETAPASSDIHGPPAIVADAPNPQQLVHTAQTRIGPKAIALIRQRGLDEKVFANNGLVTERDVLRHLGEALPTALMRPQAIAAAEPAGIVAAIGVPFASRELPRAKRIEAKYLQSSHAHTLPSTVAVVVPTRGIRRSAEEHPLLGSKFSAAIIFECAQLLRNFPQFNAFHSQGIENLYQQTNIGFAIDAGHGLKVLVIRDANAKSIPQIMTERQDLIMQYLDNRLMPQSLASGTFTISDLSGEGVRWFVPVINQGQSAILGIGDEIVPPGKETGSYELILSFDHHLAEGRLAAQFLMDLRERLIGHELALLGDKPPSPHEPVCSSCHRTFGKLNNMGVHLVKIVADRNGQETLVCSLCMEGW